MWGSGGAHKTYFEKIDNIIIELFNKPIEEQPLGIADMGCGNGMLLMHLYELILTKTARGKQIDKYPLKLIGADLNQRALDLAEKNLFKSNIESRFLLADISNPNLYKKNIKENYNIDISDLLHVRSFLDHNRIYKKVKQNNNVPHLTSTGAYSYRGEYLDSKNISSNLIYHFKQWKKHINSHGLIILELHGLNTKLAQENISLTPTIAYEATHGYSDQYIVEYNFFLKCIKIAGLKKISKHSRVFPNKKLTTISINIFK